MLGMNITLRIENQIIINMSTEITINTLVPELKGNKLSDFAVRKKIKDSNYYTNYDIIDVKKKKSVLNQRRQACFSFIFTHRGGYNKLNFSKNSNQKLIIYAPSSFTRLSEKEVRLYIKELKKLKIPFKYKFIKDFDLNIDRKNIIEREDHHIMEVSLNKVTYSKMKVIAYLFRYIYELDHDLIVKTALKYKKESPNKSFFSLLDLATTVVLRTNRTEDCEYELEDGHFEKSYGTGHLIGDYFSLKVGLTTKNIINYINNYEDDFNNSIISYLFKDSSKARKELKIKGRYGEYTMSLCEALDLNFKESYKQIMDKFNNIDLKKAKDTLEQRGYNNIEDIKITFFKHNG